MYVNQIEMGQRLRELRTENGFTQEMLAMKLQVSCTHYKNIEHGDKRCSIDLLLALSELFHVTTDYLLTGIRTSKEEEIEQLKEAISILNNIIRHG